MKKLLIILSILLTTSIVQSTLGDEVQAIKDRIASYQQLVRNNAGTVEQRNYYKRKIIGLKRSLKDYDTVDISKEVDMDMQAVDSAVTTPFHIDPQVRIDIDKSWEEYHKKDLADFKAQLEEDRKSLKELLANIKAEGKKQDAEFKRQMKAAVAAGRENEKEEARKLQEQLTKIREKYK